MALCGDIDADDGAGKNEALEGMCVMCYWTANDVGAGY